MSDVIFISGADGKMTQLIVQEEGGVVNLMDNSVADLVSTGETIQIMVDSLNIDAMFIWMLGSRHT